MLWIETVPSTRCQTMKTTASETAKNAVETTYGTCRPMWSTSAAIVPNTATITTASQYGTAP